ncbi:MAG TPA: hypothetical protein VK563_22985 [Puia sp.]|nr:hypothetical protein [Puia sp.]
MDDPDIVARIAVPADVKYVYSILKEMECSAAARGTGIARRSPQSLCKKIYEGKAVIAVAGGGGWAGFSYIESWGDGTFVSNSGLIVNPVYRHAGVATMIKKMIVELSQRRYPMATIFSITTGAAVLSLNHKMGFEPVTYAAITDDKGFWDQCKSCVNYPLLESKERKICLCTAMVLHPQERGNAYTGETEKRIDGERRRNDGWTTDGRRVQTYN